jgi:hypothetical protein
MSGVGSVTPGGGGGTTVFTGLTDTPANYTGSGLDLVRVNAGETALEFVTVAAGTVDAPSKIIRNYTAGVLLRDVVYQRADGTVDRADADAGVASTIPVVGVVSAIDSPGAGQCEITYAGDVPGFAGLTTGKVYILSTTPGGIVADDDTGNGSYPDITPGSGDVSQEVGYASSATSLFVGVLRDYDVF